MKFWDSSAIVPLLVHEAPTRELQRLFADDPHVVVWWTTEAECASAIGRLERTHALAAEGIRHAFSRLGHLAAAWTEIEPVRQLRETAIRFLRVHDLRTGDALQLAAAFMAAEGRPPALEFVCRDERLLRAAEREGFRTL